MSDNFQGSIHPKEKKNYEKGCIAKQLRRLKRREERKVIREVKANG